MTAPPAPPTSFVLRRGGMLIAAGLVVSTGVWRIAESRTREVGTERTQPVLATPERRVFERGLDSLELALVRLDSAVSAGSIVGARRELRAARLSYKRTEALAAVYAPALHAELVGPRADADADEPPLPLGAPAVFQWIGSALSDPHARDSVAAARRAIARLRPALAYVTISPADALDAARLELARVETLGLAGFDNDGPDALVECAEALAGVRAVIGAEHRATPELAALDTALRRAESVLRAVPNDELDRLSFIVRYGNPAARAIAAARKRLPAPSPLRRVWAASAGSVFERGAFDPWAFAPSMAAGPTPELVSLGHRLFFDPDISGTRTRSCATCHVPQVAYSDGRPRASTLTPEQQAAARNTPTLLNVGLQPALFWDQRAGSLEDQIAAVLASPAEMASSADLAARHLSRDTSYRAAFGRAFGRPASDSVVGRELRVAVAAYLRTLTALNSRFDRAVRGDTAAMTSEERRGFNVFLGKGRCGTCHFMPLLNGTMPPEFVESEPEIIGVPADRGHSGVDADPGRGGVDHWEQHRHAFKVPTLRNVVLTAPYMHNGVFQTLEQVIDFYDAGGGAGLGMTLPTQTLVAQPLHLTPRERAELLAFLRTLTDTVTR